MDDCTKGKKNDKSQFSQNESVHLTTLVRIYFLIRYLFFYTPYKKIDMEIYMGQNVDDFAKCSVIPGGNCLILINQAYIKLFSSFHWLNEDVSDRFSIWAGWKWVCKIIAVSRVHWVPWMTWNSTQDVKIDVKYCTEIGNWTVIGKTKPFLSHIYFRIYFLIRRIIK